LERREWLAREAVDELNEREREREGGAIESGRGNSEVAAFPSQVAVDNFCGEAAIIDLDISLSNMNSP
jgi:hypothetical protein